MIEKCREARNVSPYITVYRPIINEDDEDEEKQNMRPAYFDIDADDVSTGIFPEQILPPLGQY